MIVGVDIGYSTTKTSEGISFLSKISSDDQISGNDTITVDGKAYAIGVGSGTLDVDKINSELTRVCLFTALAMSSNENTFSVVTGLPIGQFQALKDSFKSSIETASRATVIYHGSRREININRVKVYAQGAGALLSQHIPGNAIIIDIGSRTTDIALFEVENGKRTLSRSTTLFAGVMSLYSDVVQAANRQYKLSLLPSYGESIMRDDLIVDGIIRSKEFVHAICRDHLEQLFYELDLNYPARTTPIYLCGGGAYTLGRYIKARYPATKIMEQSQFANAIGFAKVGEKIWTA